jgi:hypothetical protein
MKMNYCGSIIGQRINLWEGILSILLRFVAIAVMIVIAWAVISTLIDTSTYITAYIIIGLGVILALISFLSNIRHNSPISLGLINRGEFYGVVVVIIGSFFYLNTRVDALFTLVSQIK